jgi:hypothetical protein
MECRANQGWDGFDDGEEVLEQGADPLDPTPDPVPEPTSGLTLLAGAGLLGVLYRRRARNDPGLH